MPRNYTRKIESKAMLQREGKLTVIKDLIAQGKTQMEIATLLGVSRQNINQQLNRPKFQARSKVRLAVKRGELIKPEICTMCLVSPVTSGHHNDYEKPLEVMWLCEPCHVSVDNKGWNERYPKDT